MKLANRFKVLEESHWKRFVQNYSADQATLRRLSTFCEFTWELSLRLANERFLNHHGYSAAQLLWLSKRAFRVKDFWPRRPRFWGRVGTYKLDVLKGWQKLSIWDVYCVLLVSLRREYGKTARDRWRVLAQWCSVRDVALYWLECTQRTLCAPGGKGRRNDLVEYRDDRQLHKLDKL